MAESHNHVHISGQKEAKGCGLFDFLAKKEEKPEKDVVVNECKGKKEEDKLTLMEELHCSHSHSSSSSEEEVEEGGERKKKKKNGLKEKTKETVISEKEEKGKEPFAAIPAEKCDETEVSEVTVDGEEKKGVLEKMNDKLPARHKKTEESFPTVPTKDVADSHLPRGEAKEKKGILEKIMDKLPGSHGHKNGEDQVKHKENPN